MFSTLSKTEIIILSTLILLSANAYNLDQSKSLLFGKELNIQRTVKKYYHLKTTSKRTGRHIFLCKILWEKKRKQVNALFHSEFVKGICCLNVECCIYKYLETDIGATLTIHHYFLISKNIVVDRMTYLTSLPMNMSVFCLQSLHHQNLIVKYQVKGEEKHNSPLICLAQFYMSYVFTKGYLTLCHAILFFNDNF